MKEYAAVTGAEQNDWQALTKDVAAGNLQSAQADLAHFQQLQPGGGGTAQDSALKALSTAFSSGDQAAAETALQTATSNLSNQSINDGNLVILLANAANDAQLTPNWIQELDNFGGTLAPMTISNTQTSGDAFTQDLEAIQQASVTGMSGLTNFLISQGYSSDLATADTQMAIYKNTIDSLSTVVHDMSQETKSSAVFEISRSVTEVGKVGGTERAFTLSTDEAFTGHIGIKNVVTESELAQTATGAIATAAVVDFGPSRPPSSTATVAVDGQLAAEALSSLSGYQVSFSVTETQSSLITAASAEESATRNTTIPSQTTGGVAQDSPQGQTLTVSDAWASVAAWVQKVDSYAAGKSSWTFVSSDPVGIAKVDTSFESAAHQTKELLAMTLGSERTTTKS